MSEINEIEIEDVRLTAKNKYPLHYHLMEVNLTSYNPEDKGYSSNIYIDDLKGYVSVRSRVSKLHQ